MCTDTRVWRYIPGHCVRRIDVISSRWRVPVSAHYSGAVTRACARHRACTASNPSALSRLGPPSHNVGVLRLPGKAGGANGRTRTLRVKLPAGAGGRAGAANAHSPRSLALGTAVLASGPPLTSKLGREGPLPGLPYSGPLFILEISQELATRACSGSEVALYILPVHQQRRRG